jgi:hypothetical protein
MRAIDAAKRFYCALLARENRALFPGFLTTGGKTLLGWRKLGRRFLRYFC